MRHMRRDHSTVDGNIKQAVKMQTGLNWFRIGSPMVSFCDDSGEPLASIMNSQ